MENHYGNYERQSMKKRCLKCGKKFNYEDSMGICPHCGKYTSPYASKDDTAKRATPTPVHRSSYKEASVPVQSIAKETSVPKQRKQLDIKAIIIVLLIIMIIMAPMAFVFLEDKKIIEIENERKVETLQEVEEYVLQPFEVVTGGVNAEVTIEDAKPFVFEGVKATEGWKYIEVCYQVKSETYLSYYSYVDVLLHWGGHYVEGLSAYDLSDDEFVRDALYKSDIAWTGLERGRGRWVFLVPQDIDEATIEIYEKQDIPNTKYRKLNKVYLVDVKVED